MKIISMMPGRVQGASLEEVKFESLVVILIILIIFIIVIIVIIIFERFYH